MQQNALIHDTNLIRIYLVQSKTGHICIHNNINKWLKRRLK